MRVWVASFVWGNIFEPPINSIKLSTNHFLHFFYLLLKRVVIGLVGLHTGTAVLVEVHLHVITKVVLEVKLLHGFRGVILGLVGHDGFASGLNHTDGVGRHLEGDAEHLSELGADGLESVFAELNAPK